MTKHSHFQTKTFEVSSLKTEYKEVRAIVRSSKERAEIFYPANIKTIADNEWLLHKEQIVKDNNSVLESCRNRAGVYAIYTTIKGGKAELQYIGQTTDKTSLMRMVNHLIYKHKNTGAQLESVRTAVVNGEKVELVFVEINPKELREYVEHKLITDLKPKWNKKGK